MMRVSWKHLCILKLFFFFLSIVNVDCRVRDQLRPLLVDHEEITIGFNQWIRFIQNKIDSIFTFSHTISPTYSFLLRPILFFFLLIRSITTNLHYLFFSL